MYKQEMFSACIALFLFSCELDEIPDEITFDHVYLGLGPAQQIVQLPNEGYAVCGRNTDDIPGEASIYLAFFNKVGTLTRKETFSISKRDYVENMIMLSSGALAMIGATTAANDFPDILYIKTDTLGEPLAGPKAIVPAEGFDWGFDLVEPDNCTDRLNCGIMVLGLLSDGESMSVLMTDTQGNRIFSKKIPGSEGLFVTDIISLDGNYYIVGGGYISGIGKSLLWKLDPAGDLVAGFPKVFHNEGHVSINTIVRSSTGDLILGGVTFKNIGHKSNIYLIKTDLSGNPIAPFPLVIGSESEEDFNVNELLVVINDNIMVVGEKGIDAYVINLNSDGGELWNREFGGPQQRAYFNSVLNTPDGGYIFAGSKDNSLYLVKTDSQGIVEP